jgi:hypothetical protein
MADHGPGARETRIYLAIGVAGLAVTGGAALALGGDAGAAKPMLAGGLLFGGAVVWALRRLRRLAREARDG